MRNRTLTRASLAFAAVADPTRRAVLDLLLLGDSSAGEIAGHFRISRPAISKHLRLLRRAMLVRQTRRGRHLFYRLNPLPLAEVHAWLEPYYRYWSQKLLHLKAFAEGVEAQPKPRSRHRAAKRRALP